MTFMVNDSKCIHPHRNATLNKDHVIMKITGPLRVKLLVELDPPNTVYKFRQKTRFTKTYHIALMCGTQGILYGMHMAALL